MAKVFKDSSFGQLSNDLNKFGQDVTGTTAKREAEKAALKQEEAQNKLETTMAEKEKLKAYSLDYKTQRNQNKAAAMQAGGRAGTLLTGFTDSAASPMASTGVKTLLGQ